MTIRLTLAPTKRIPTVALASLLSVAVLTFQNAETTPKVFLWNASASVPEGLYYVERPAKLRLGDYAVTDLPTDMANLAAARHYLPHGVSLIKPVSAVAGMRVCRTDIAISVNGTMIGAALREDKRRRSLPKWSGCQDLTRRQLFLMNPAVRDSFDGRYFGPTPTSLVKARAVPLFILVPAPPIRKVHPSHPQK